MVEFNMPKKKPPLSETNPYLKDPKDRRFWIRTTVCSSAAIEGIHFSKKEVERILDESVLACKRVSK